MSKKILLIGNHSCSNRGDAAITRGLIEALEEHFPNSELTIYSRFPKGASKILGTLVRQDLTAYHPKLINKVLNRIYRLLNIDFDLHCVIGMLVFYLPFLQFILPKYMKETIAQMKSQDIIIHVGGSFYVDLYGLTQFRSLVCSLLSKRRVLLIGHSLGPFGNLSYQLFSAWCFSKTESITIRDKDSFDMVEQISSKIPLIVGADTAWLVNSYMVNHDKEKTIALTARKLAPFDKRLNLTQENYELVMAKLAEYYLDKGYKIKFFSTCTSYDGYHNDDRVIAYSIVSKIDKKMVHNALVIEDELTDIELGQALANCELTIGTRLHSTIISMNFGTVALALAYEHKATGLYQDMRLDPYCIQLSSDFSVDDVVKYADDLLDNQNNIHELVDMAVKKQRSLALKSVLESIERLEK